MLTLLQQTVPPMSSTSFADPNNPNLASSMITTPADYQVHKDPCSCCRHKDPCSCCLPADYQAFFSAYFAGSLVSSAARIVMESDQVRGT